MFGLWERETHSILSSDMKSRLVWIIWRVRRPRRCGELSMTHRQLRLCRKFRNERQLHCPIFTAHTTSEIKRKSLDNVSIKVDFTSAASFSDRSWSMKQSLWRLVVCIAAFHCSLALIVSLSTLRVCFEWILWKLFLDENSMQHVWQGNVHRPILQLHEKFIERCNRKLRMQRFDEIFRQNSGETNITFQAFDTKVLF